MASSSSSSSFSASTRVSSFCSSLFILACLFQQRCHLIKADQEFIDKVCDKTREKNREFCQECFKDDCKYMGIVDLALCAINCSSTTSINARKATNGLGQRSTGQFQEICFACVTELDETVSEFNFARKMVGIGRYGDGIYTLKKSQNRAVNCSETVGSDKVRELATLTGDIEVAINVVEQIG